MGEVFVVGVGMTEFVKPHSRNWDYPDMARISGTDALNDAGIGYDQVEAVVASYCYGEPTSGQRAVYELGLSGVPVFNVNNNCSSGSSAIMLARHLVQSGAYSCVMAIGFEKMEKGLSERFPEKASPVRRHFDKMIEFGASPTFLPKMNEMTSEVIRMFAFAAREHMEKHPGKCRKEDFAKIAVKNRTHGQQNPKAALRHTTISQEKALSDRMICDPITVHQSSLTADGSACAIICNRKFLQTQVQAANRPRSIRILGQSMVTDLPQNFKPEGGFKALSGYDMAKQAAQNCFREAGVRAEDVDVVEVHDCFAPNEFLMYEALGLAEEGGASSLLNSGKWEENRAGGKVFRMGRWVVNPSGGLESKGHPIGATGIAQCFELVSQLRGEAEKRQVEGARTGLQHNFGIGGACVVTLYSNINTPQSRL